MSKQRNDFRLGLTVLVMFALLVGCLLFIGGKGLSRATTRTLTVRMQAKPAMPEISKGSLVICFGQPVGKVVDTHFVSGPDPAAPTGSPVQYLEIKATALAELDLRADCVVVAGGPPLGGKGYLEIVDRGVAAAELTEDDVLHAGASGLQTALAQLAAEFNDANPNSLMAQIKAQLRPELDDSLIAKIHISLDNIATMTAALSAQVDIEQSDVLLAKVHAALDQVNVGLSEVVAMVEETRPRVGHALDAADHAMVRIDEDIVAALADELDRGNQASLLAKTHESMVRLNQSLGDLNTVTGETRRTVVLNTARIDLLVQNATEASALLKRGIKDLALQPWRLLEKPNQRERDELEDIDVAREFADAAARLDDAAVRLKALADAEGAALRSDDENLIRIQQELSVSVEEFFKAERALYQRLQGK
jgi:hypothetical protein